MNLRSASREDAAKYLREEVVPKLEHDATGAHIIGDAVTPVIQLLKKRKIRPREVGTSWNQLRRLRKVAKSYIEWGHSEFRLGLAKDAMGIPL